MIAARDTAACRKDIMRSRHTAADGPPNTWSACGMIFAIGLFGIVGQSVLFRRFLTVFEGNELGIALFFTSWLGWVAAGAGLARSRALRTVTLSGRFEFLALLFIPACLLQGWLIQNARGFSGVAAYEFFPLARMVPASVLANAPISLLTGALFALACRWMSRTRRLPVATVYIAETVGSCAGGIAVTVLLWQGMAGETVLLGASLVLAVAFCFCRLARRDRLSAAVPLIALVVVHAAGLDAAWRRANALHTWRRLLPVETYQGTFTTPQARYLYGEHRGQINVVAWESIAESIPNTEYASEVIAIHLAQHPDARRFLVIGSGSFTICRRLLDLPQAESVTWLGTDPAYPPRVLGILPDRLKTGIERLATPGVDTRSYLRNRTDTYDLVVLNLPDATTLALNRFFTREFFQLLETRLADGGVVGVPVSGGANFMGGELINVGATVYHTLGTIFEHRVIKPGDQSWILASHADRLSASPARLRDRFRGIENSEQVYPAEGLMSLYLPDRIEAQEARYRAAVETAPAGTLLNTDRLPRALFHSLQLAAREAGTALSLTAALRTFAARGRLVVPLALGLYAVLRFICLVRDSRRRTGPGVAAGARPFDSGFLVFSTGAVGMALSTVLMFMYQSVFGSIFLHVGLIAAIFMLGLFCGSLATQRRLAGKGPPGAGASFAIIGGHALLVLAMVRLPGDLPRGVFALLFFLGGLFSGVYVPLAAARLRAAGRADGAAGALVEASDHVGGACGALLTGLVLLPVFGSGYALLVVAGTLAVNLPPLVLRAEAGEETPGRDRLAAAVRQGGYLLFGLAAFLMAASLRLHGGREIPVRRLFEDAARSMAGRIEPVERRHAGNGDELVYYVATNAAGNAEAYLFSSALLAPDIVGYGGPLTLAVMTDADGTLVDFRTLHSHETPAYLDLLAPWMRGLKGRNLFEPGALTGVDAVSGATLSSEAVSRALRTAGNAFAHRVLGATATTPASTRPRSVHDIRVPVVTLLAVLALVLRARPRRRTRQVFLAVVVLTCGFALNAQYSLAHALPLLELQVPPPGWRVVFLLVCLLPVFVLCFGNVYCGYLCPFGALQELVGDLRPARLDTDPDATSWRYARPVKFVLLFLVIAAFSLSLDLALASHDPLVSAFSAGRSRFIAWLAGTVLLLSFFYRRFWCRTLCPAGAFLALLNGVQLLRRFIPRVNYKRCPFGVSDSGQVDCICCDRCRAATPREQEALRTARGKPAGRHTLFLVAVAALGLLMAWQFVSTVPGIGRVPAGSPGARPSGAAPRDVDMGRLRRMIERGVLTDHEARYYSPVEGPPYRSPARAGEMEGQE